MSQRLAPGSATAARPPAPEEDGPPQLRAGFEGSGSPRWLMRAMQLSGFDRARGFRLDLVLLNETSHRHGSLQALAERRVDIVDADQQALAAARADGLPLIAVYPYGRILGSLVIRRDYRPTAADDLALVHGCRLGVLSTGDKNWRLLADACRQLASFELATACRPVHYAQRAALLAGLESGEIDAALVHWHLVPGLLAAGHRVLAELPALADALAGTARAAPTPSTFFVAHLDLARRRPALLESFATATADAVRHLCDAPQPWQALADEGAIERRHLAALRVRWQARVGDFHRTSHSRSTPCNPY